MHAVAWPQGLKDLSRAIDEEEDEELFMGVVHNNLVQVRNSGAWWLTACWLACWLAAGWPRLAFGCCAPAVRSGGCPLVWNVAGAPNPELHERRCPAYRD